MKLNQNIRQLLESIKEKPYALIPDYDDGNDLHFKVICVDTRKRYTEFYRVRALFKKNGKLLKQHYWFRIVKNKPIGQIHEALTKQFEIMGAVYFFFDDLPSSGILKSCQPLSLLTKYNAVITKECTGTLFNKYLQTRFPLLSKDKIIKHFTNCGLWLRKYHEFYKYDNKNVEEYDIYLSKFLLKYKREPLDSLKYITLCHNDYSPRNIFVAEKSVEVIDFVGASMGLPEEDTEFFKNYIRKAKFNFLYAQKFKENLLRAFDHGYMHGVRN